MRKFVALTLPLLALIAAPAMAAEVVVVEETVEVTEYVVSEGAAERFVPAAPAPIPQGVARFGPFRVIDASRAALVDVTDERSPAQFEAMLRAYPGIATLEMIECPGTEAGSNCSWPARAAWPIRAANSRSIPGPTKMAARPGTIPPTRPKTGPMSIITRQWACPMARHARSMP
jgi:hypothetical protein